MSFWTRVASKLKKTKFETSPSYVLKISLSGNVTFNPVYKKDLLRNSNFIEIAQMIKSAASNYMGASKDKFWDEAAFNLIKNTLVLAYVKRDYFTLNDIYQDLVATDEEEKVETLTIALESKKYDEEQRCNITFAKNYFQGEFGQLDTKVKTSVLVSATTFLNQFQEARASKIFCPSLEDLTIRSMDEIVDEGKSLIVDIETPGLSKSMGTFIKLHYQKSVLDRLGDPSRSTKRPAVIVMDEYQDIVTVSGGSIIGDEKALAKGREANIITIAASQSYSSIVNAINNDKAARELIQNFRTKIAYHSADEMTINHFKNLLGQKDVEKTSRIVSEMSQNPTTNLILGGMESQSGSISESYNQSLQKEFQITGKEFTALKTFEAIALVYDGTKTQLRKLCMKPQFLKKKNTPHAKVLKYLTGVFAASFLNLSTPSQAFALFPNICSVVKTPAFRECTEFRVSPCLCGFPIPRPCSRIEMYIPETFIEVQSGRKDTYFRGLPGAELQLGTLPNKFYQHGYVTQLDRSFFHARTLAIPFASFMLAGLPCGGQRMDTTCFDAMSEHIDWQWTKGSGDKLQPKFLAWSLSPKLCLMKAAVTSVHGTYSMIPRPGGPLCSVPMPELPTLPPSDHPQCTGHGFFFPRIGHVEGPATNTAALLVAARMKSLASEVFLSTPNSPLEKWQGILPNETTCFKEGQQMTILEPFKQVTEKGRLMGAPPKGYLFAVWKKVSCCVDIPQVAQAKLYLEIIKQTCNVFGG